MPLSRFPSLSDSAIQIQTLHPLKLADTRYFLGKSRSEWVQPVRSFSIGVSPLVGKWDLICYCEPDRERYLRDARKGKRLEYVAEVL